MARHFYTHVNRHDACQCAAYLYVAIWKRRPREKYSQICLEWQRKTQPCPNTCPFQITKVRDLDFLQNDENIIYILQIPISSSRGDKTFSA